MKKSILVSMVILFCNLVHAKPVTYLFKEVWTGGTTLNSTAPNPECPCNRNLINRYNIKECAPEGFTVDDSVFMEITGFAVAPQLCYDEYIPDGSNGWAHALVYELVNTKPLTSQP
ncbi:MAG: hypothetical protein J0M15_12045 [Deltaproteobacteria bacterium]|nr:hypothetical protein [Deltaproteobacteria bacterium]